VKDSVDIADVRYAVVEVPRIEGGCDRFVVAYPHENCLYDLIASPRIVACGFASREAAAAVAEAHALKATIQNCVPCGSETDQTLRSLRRFFVDFYNDAVAAAILMFSSRNIISSAIRTFLAVSF
jgi:hypothetical protein